MKKNYIYGLDIFRTFALIIVVGYHFFPRILPGGFIGVDIFFVLSGYLTIKSIIGGEKNGLHFSFFGFMKKRVLRLFPAMVSVILFFSALSILFSRDFNSILEKQFFGSFIFFDNWTEILTGSSYETNLFPRLFKNMWALGCEFQFYIIISILISIFYLFFTKKIAYNILTGLSLLLTILSIFLMIFFASKGLYSRSYYGTDSHSGSLFLGVFLALILEKIREKILIKNSRKKISSNIYFRLIGILILLVYFVALIYMSTEGYYERKSTFFFSIPLCGLFTTIALFFVINMQEVLKKIPHNPFKVISNRSYSIYLCHVPITTLMFQTDFSKNKIIIFSIILTILFSEILYWGIEVPFFIEYIRKRMLKSKKYFVFLIIGFILTFSISIFNIISAPYISNSEKTLQKNTYKKNEKIMNDLDIPVNK